MVLEHYSIDKLKAEILEIAGKYLDLNSYKIFIFGSRAAGKGDERSDIDIGIDGPQKIPVETMEKIKEEIDKIPVLYKIDIVDFSDTSDKFKKVAKEYIEIINKN